MITTRRARIVAVLALAFASSLARAARAEVRLPKVFGSHMVLQRDRPVPIWGWATPGESVAAEFGSATGAAAGRVSGTATANAAGEWRITLPAMRANASPATLTVRGSSTVTFDDVLVGEVWLCSGQSNMEFGVGMGRDAAREVAGAKIEGLRLLLVHREWKPAPVDDIAGEWKPSTPETVVQGGWNGFSAVGYFFGRELRRELGVPVGMIEASWGGTRIEPWTPPVGFAAVPSLKEQSDAVRLALPGSPEHDGAMLRAIDAIDAWSADARRAVAQHAMVPAPPGIPGGLKGPDSEQSPTGLYNGCIHPICPFAIRGAIWDQGEANEPEGAFYTERMKALVAGWRSVWGEGDFPFYFVQLAPFNYTNVPNAPTRLAEMWEAQSAAEAAIPNTGMVVVNDIGNVNDIHPTNKQDVGHRLAIRALADTYGRTGLLARSPAFKSLATEGDALRVTFDYAGSGLSSRDGKPITWFEIASEESHGFHRATARADGSAVVLTAAGVTRPTAVRFAWNNLAEPNLINSARLPASAFRAGGVPMHDSVTPNVPELKDYTLAYDLDLGTMSHEPRYTTDAHAAITRPFDRIAYALELEDPAGHRRWAYASMDAFTDDASKIAIPTPASHARFQRGVAHLNVFSNVPEVTKGTDLAGGNIEFWPNNYDKANAGAVAGASDDAYDFGDRLAEEVPDGYGCLQVHNHDARQTILAVNNWRDGDGGDVGIGNAATGQPDWTFAKNAGHYPVKRLRVFVRQK